MSTLRQAAQQALEALEWSKPHADASITYEEAIANLRAALAEPVNFCPRCGKRAYPDTIHTCTPPAFMG